MWHIVNNISANVLIACAFVPESIYFFLRNKMKKKLILLLLLLSLLLLLLLNGDGDGGVSFIPFYWTKTNWCCIYPSEIKYEMTNGIEWCNSTKQCNTDQFEMHCKIIENQTFFSRLLFKGFLGILLTDVALLNATFSRSPSFEWGASARLIRLTSKSQP